MVLNYLKTYIKNDCVGCTACMLSCPEDCIDIIVDREGFSYPLVDVDKCIHCGVCDKVCPVVNIKKNNRPDSYALIHKDKEVVRASSSGGAFSAIADALIKEGFCIYGAAYDEEFNVKHICIHSSDELWRLRGSKYVQSDLNKSYISVQKDLNNGKKVLFSGTPCQIMGLRNFINHNHDNLYCVDLICHGVPSPLFFNKYKNYMEHEKGDKIASISFSFKKHGWVDKRIRFQFANMAPYERLAITFDDNYMASFLRHYTIRPSCFSCRFTTLERVGDITLGDCWGVNKVLPKIDIRDGVSLILLNTQKGNIVTEIIKDQVMLYPVGIEEISLYNPQLITPPIPHKDRDIFMNDFLQKDMGILFKKYQLLRPAYIRKLSELKYRIKSYY